MLAGKSPKLIFGFVAFTIYFLLIGLLVFYFNTHNDNKPKRYVKKNENRIQVSLSTPQKKTKPIPVKSKKPTPPKVKKKTDVKKTKKYVVKSLKKKSQKNKNNKKKIIKEKIVKKISKKPLKKKDETNNTKTPKKKKITKKVKKKTKKVHEKKVEDKKIEKKKVKKIQKTSELFSKITSKPKIVSKKEKTYNKKEVDHKAKLKSISALEKIQQATSSKQSDSGIENAYFAKVQSLLETWPAQSEYAGQKAMVRIFVKPTGAFDFKVKSKSNNVDFNLGLIDFLEQLKRLGLGSHKGGKTYEIEVEFTAKK